MILTEENISLAIYGNITATYNIECQRIKNHTHTQFHADSATSNISVYMYDNVKDKIDHIMDFSKIFFQVLNDDEETFLEFNGWPRISDKYPIYGKLLENDGPYRVEISQITELSNKINVVIYGHSNFQEAKDMLKCKGGTTYGA